MLVIAVILGPVGSAAGQTATRSKKAVAAAEGPVADYQSRNFLIHTDLPAAEAKDLLNRLETELVLISRYWGRPLSGTIECYVMKDLKNWDLQKLDPNGVESVRAGGGLTITRSISDGKKFLAKSVVYAKADRGTPQHEMVHAYCGQTFGRTGPVWYAEGMAELGQYWRENDLSVNAHPGVIDYLRKSPPKPLSEVLAPFQVTGDSWQNYAWRWALCHLMEHNPNYKKQFRPLGLGLLTGEDVSFERVYGGQAKELEFEYHFFLAHLEAGLRCDLIAFDFTKKVLPLAIAGRTLSATIQAGRGWQPAGLMVTKGTEYSYDCGTGTWKVGKQAKAVSADGDEEGTGRLVGAILKDHQLSPPFDLGAKGSFTAAGDGNLYLRCRSKWNELADNSGRVSVKLQLKGKGAK